MPKFKPKQYISYVLKKFCQENELTYIEEFKFLEKRKFRFDWYVEELRLGIEYEGIVSNKSRHTSITGFTRDCEKYNLAQINGYDVLRFTVINYTDLEEMMTKYVNKQVNKSK